jgi:hypothetical protein
MATPRTADVLGAALKLPRKERARVAHELLISLDGATDEEVERAWVEEAERRWADVKSGKAELFDADAVLRDAAQITQRSSRPAGRKKAKRTR